MRRPWPALRVLLASAALAFLAWPAFDLLEPGSPFEVPTRYQWPLFWLGSLAALTGLLLLANGRRAPLDAWLRSVPAALLGFVGGLVIAAYVYLAFADVDDAHG